MEQIESVDNFNIYSFCRTCLENLNDIEMSHDIFAKQDLQIKLTVCTSLPLEPNDGFPTTLCETCCTKIEEFYIFHQMCISSRKRFQEYLHLEKKPWSTIDASNKSTDLMMSIEVKKEKEEDDSVYLSQYAELVKEEFSIDVKDESKCSSNEEESEESQSYGNHCGRIDEEEEDIDGMSDSSNIPSNLMMLTKAEIENDPIVIDQISVKEEFPLNPKEQAIYSSNEEESEESKIKDHSSNDCDRTKEIEETSGIMVKSNGRRTTRKKKLECKICKKQFRIIGKLEVHMRQHQGLKPFPCHLCNKSYSRRDTLKYHMQDKHEGQLPPTDAKFACDPSIIPTDLIMLTKATRQNEEEDSISVDQFSEVNKEEFSNSYTSNETKSEESQLNAECNSSHNNTLSLECEICKQCFKKSDKLERHLRLHKGLKPFPCNLCDKSYSRRNRLNLHKQEKHNGKIPSVEVEFAIDSSNTPEDLTEAQQKMVDEEIVKEEFSFNVINSSNVELTDKLTEVSSSKGIVETIDPSGNIHPRLIMLTEVKKENKEEVPISLNQVPELSINAVDQMNYSSSEKEIEPNNEKKINKKKMSNNNCDGIKKIKETCHKTKKTLKCEICKKFFRKAENLELHMRVHQGLKPYSCQFCERSYTRKNTLRLHICIHKLAQRKPRKPRNSYVCEQCGKVLATAATLKNHCYLHTGLELPYECPRCQKRYITRSLLRRHMDRHACSNLICPHCGAKRKTQKDLKRHINSHTKEKGYPCQLCDMVFYSNGRLNKHKRAVHEDIKDFPCLYCDKSFGTAEARKGHEIIHTGEKPFECDTCHKKFTRIITLKRHQKVHLIDEY